jgi:hypothetical protein
MRDVLDNIKRLERRFRTGQINGDTLRWQAPDRDVEEWKAELAENQDGGPLDIKPVNADYYDRGPRGDEE